MVWFVSFVVTGLMGQGDGGGNIVFFDFGRYWLGYSWLRSGFKNFTLTGFDWV